MIVTLTANAAIDRTLCIETLRPGSRLDVARDDSQAGGKGVNVARVLHALGSAVHGVVLVGGEAGAWILRDLERARLPTTPVWTRGESRTCLEIVETATGRTTQLHGVGVRADPEVGEALWAALAARLPGARWLALCGSLAAGLPDELYARLVARAQRAGVLVAVDASGPALRAAWAARPDLVRVNRAEAEAALGAAAAPPDRNDEPTGGPRALAVVSDGAEAISAWTADGDRWRIEPPRVALRNPIGCGDAMLAGLLHGLLSGASPRDVLREAVALAAADAESWVAGRPDPERARVLRAGVRLERA